MTPLETQTPQAGQRCSPNDADPLHTTLELIPDGGWRGPEDEQIPPGGWRGPEDEKIPPGGWRTVDTYRSKDGRAYFRFRFVNVGDHFQIDILDQPSYGGRSAGGHGTHRIESPRGGARICFADEAILRSEGDCYKWSQQWAEQTWEYIKTGKPLAS